MFKRLSLFALLCLFYSASTLAHTFKSTEGNIISRKFREITISVNRTGLCGGEVELRTAIVGATYQWIKDGIDISGANAISYKTTVAGKYKLKITYPDTSEDTSNEIEIVAGVYPIASFTSNATGNQCSSEEIIFTNTSTGSGLTYQWDFGDPKSGTANTSTETNPKHVFVGEVGNDTQTFNVKLKVTNSDGCSDEKVLTVTTKKLPDAKLGGTGSTLYNGLPYFKICANNASSFNFTNQSTTTNTSYHINWGDGSADFSATNFTSISHVYQIGLNTLTYTVTGVNGCVNVFKYYVFVGSNPAGNIVPRGNTNICTKQTLTFDISGIDNNPPGTVYKISFNDGTPSITLTHPLVDKFIVHTFEKSSCGTTSNSNGTQYPNSFAVSFEASNPCGDTPGGAGGIYVSDRPEASFTIQPKKIICENTAVSFTNTSKGGTVTASGCAKGNIVWKIEPLGTATSNGYSVISGSLGNDYNLTNDPGSWLSGSNILQINFKVAGQYKITQKIGSTGSTQFCGPDEHSEIICVNPTPVASFTLDQNSGCAPLIVKATNTSPLPTCGANTYTWGVTFTNTACSPVPTAPVYLNNTTSTSTNPEFRFDRAGIYTISLITRNSDGTCISTTVTQQITVKAKPVVTINALPAICAGLSINPTATVLNCYSSSAATYLWKFPGAVAGSETSTAQNPINILYPTSGSYTVTLEVTNDCGVTTAATTLSVNEAPITTQISDKIFCRGTVSPQINFVTSGVGTLSYSWTNDKPSIGLPASGVQAFIPQFTATNNTGSPVVANITVTPTRNGCVGTPMTFKITVNPSAETANAGVDQNLCNVNSTMLAGNDPLTSTGKWTIVSGTGINFTDDTKYNTTITGLVDGASYTLKWTINGFSPCPSTSDDVIIKVAAVTQGGTTAGDKIFCGGPNSGTISLTGNIGQVVNWEKSTDNSNWTTITSTSVNYNYTAITATTYFRAIVKSGDCAQAASTVTKITVNPIPLAPTVSLTTATYCLGEIPATLTATGTDLRWYTIVPPNASGSATTPIISTGAVGTFTYYVTQTVDGCESPYQTITIKVNASIANNVIKADQTICIGGIPTNLTVNSGLPTGGTGSYTYQWQQSLDNLSFSNISGATNPSYQPTALTADRYFKRIVTSGNCSSESNIVKITVQGSITNFQIASGQKICSGSIPAKLVGEIPLGGSGSYVYTWEKSTVSATAGFMVITGENGADYQPGALSQTTYFKRKVKSGSCDVESTVIEISVNPIPVMQAIPEMVLCNGSTTALISFATNQVANKITYTWVNDNLAIGLAANGTGDLPSFIAQNLTKSPIEANITVTPTFSDGGSNCLGTPLTFKVIVLPTIIANTIADFTVCPQVTVASKTLTSDAAPFAVSAVSYNWLVTGDAIGLTSGSGTQIPAFNSVNNGTSSLTANVTVTPTYNYIGKQCAGAAITYKITVNPAPNVSFSIPNQTICNNNISVEVLLSSATLGASITWTSQNVSGITGLITAGTDKIPAQTLVNNTKQPVTILYKVVAATTGSAQCLGSVFNYSITVNPSTDVSASSLTKVICSNTKTAITLSSTTPGTVFNWLVNANANISGATNGTGGVIDQTLINTSISPQTINYTVTPTFATNNQVCSGDPIVVSITVNPSPNVLFSSNNITICSGESTPKIDLTSTTPNAKISWSVVVPVGITGANQLSGTTSIDVQTLQNTSNVPLTVTYNAVAKTDDANGCDGAQFQFIVTVNPVAKITNVKLAQDICSGGNTDIVVLNSNVNNATFKWVASSSSSNLSGFVSNGVGNLPIQNIINNGTTVEQVKYIITPVANGCEGIPSTYEITVFPAPIFTADLSPQEICSKIVFNYIPKSSTSSVLFKWTRAAVNGITNSANSGSGIDAAGAINETLINNTLNPIAVVYNFTLSINGCSSSIVYPLTVTVKPAPTASFGPVSQNGCAPFQLVVKNLNSRTSGNTYTVDYGDGSPIAIFNDESDIKHIYENLATTTKTFHMSINTQNSCGVAKSIDYVILVQPQSVFSKLVLQGTDRYGCAPFLVDFTKLNQSAGANLYTWDFGDGSAKQETHSLNEQISHTYLKAGNYTVQLTATNGCSTVITDQVITVYGTVTASFDKDKVQVCIGEEIKFTNTSDPQLTSLWDFGDGTTSTDINPSHAYQTSGIKTITLTTTKTYPTGGSCVATAVKTVNVLAAPIATFTSNASQLNCGPFKLMVSSLPSNAANIEWDFGDPSSIGNLTTGFNVNHTYNKAGTYTITAKAYNLLGCTAVSTQVIKVTETPIAAFNFGPKNICGAAATVQFTNNSTYGGSDLVTYKWYVNGVLTSTAKDLIHAFNTPGTITLPYIYKIKLEASNVIGCLTAEEQQIQFNPLPVAGFTIAKDKDCAPFKPSIVNNSLFSDKFEWYIDNVLVSTDRDPQNLIFSKPDQVYELKLITDNQYGCAKSTFIKQITTYPSPTASFNLKTDISCNGILAIDITNTSTGATTYIWDYGDGASFYVGNNPKHVYGKAGTYTLKLTATNGFCNSEFSQVVRVADAPKAAFLADVKSGCNQLTVNFQNTSVNANDYLWDFGDGTFSKEKNPIHNYTYTKSPFTVKLIAKNALDCTDESVQLNYINVYAPPVADIVISPNKIIKIPSYTFTFKAETKENIINYKWDFGDGKTADQATSVHKYDRPGTYKIKLTVINIANCTNTIYDEVTILDLPGYFYLPNAFEPGSSKLDLQVFKVTGSGMESYALKIFNKWGQLIWETNKLDGQGAPLEFWDGKMNGVLQPQGAYYWRADAKFINGLEWKGMKFESGSQLKSGVIHLIR